jgi:hypothetical protein
VDYDRDGDLDLYVANGTAGPQILSRNWLYENQGDGTFRRLTNDLVRPIISELGYYDVASWVDTDNDGWLDRRIPVPLGGAEHLSWVDTDNDGWLDLYIANAWHGGETRPDLLYRNNGDGTFTKVARGSPANELGAAWAGWLVDLNNDGFLDLATFKHPLPDDSVTRYYRNNGNSDSWLGVKCVGTASPRFAAGTKVRVKATIHGKPTWQLRVIDLGGFVMGQNFTAHFGLGDAASVDVLRIEWTSGIVQELINVAVEQYLTVTEPMKLAMAQPGELHLQCWKGMAYTIEGSSDLSRWAPLISLTNLNLTGGLQWTDPDAAIQSARFYRAQRAESLGYENVRLYDSSWLEWSSRGGAVEKGP